MGENLGYHTRNNDVGRFIEEATLESRRIEFEASDMTHKCSARFGEAIAKKLERVGIPTAHLCAITQVAIMVGSNRIVPACSIVSPLGNPQLDKKEERIVRRKIIEKALEVLQAEIKEKKVFIWKY